MKSPVLPVRGADHRSSPSRGTWIEIKILTVSNPIDAVVPLTGDVD